MRIPGFALAFLILSGCATPEQRAVQQQQNIDRMISTYGPACERLGFQGNTDAWRNCILQLSAKDDYQYYSRSPSMINCINHRGFSQCTAF